MAVLATTMILPVTSYASSEGNRNSALGLAGVAAYLLMKGKTVPGLAAAVGASYAYNRYQAERKDEQFRDRYGNRHCSERYESRDHNKNRDHDNHRNTYYAGKNWQGHSNRR